MPGWVIEYPIQTSTKKYRVDAYNTKHSRIREFVHTVSPYYYQKHLVLRAERYSQINWVFDGELYVSRRARRLKEGKKNFLTPRAWQLFEKIGGLIHYEGRLWKHWRENIWFPYEHDNAKRFLDSFVAVERELETGSLAEILTAAKQVQHREHLGSSAVPPPSTDQSTN